MCGVYISKPEEITSLHSNDIILTFLHYPKLVLKRISKCSVTISNPLSSVKKARIYLRDSDMDGIKIVGLDNTVTHTSFSQQHPESSISSHNNKKIIDLTSTTSFELGLHVLPIAPGI